MNRVLIIDDDENDAFMLSQLLQVMGHSTQIVTNRRDAKTLLSGFAPHFVICSESLSESEMAPLTTNSRGAHESSCILVALSNGDDSTAGQPNVPAGFHRQLLKPIDTLQLQELMDGDSADGGAMERSANGQ